MSWIQHINWRAWIGTVLLIISFREIAVWGMSALGKPELGNLAGLIALLIVLFTWRKVSTIPLALIETNNKIMRESAFAFLPICAGALFTLGQLGNKIYLILGVLFFSTLFPLWLYAKISKRWL